jgi:proprotein convertase subtilisin/kexin type 5
VTSYYFLAADQECLSVCPDGYYQDEVTFTCGSCNSTICLTCVNDSNSCLSCAIANGYYLDSITYTPGKCVLTCPSSTYADIVSGTCKSCTYPCT